MLRVGLNPYGISYAVGLTGASTSKENPRTVVRQALQEMEYQGVIVKEKGRGAFVAEAKISERLMQKLTGFHQDMTDMGFHPVSRILKRSVGPAGTKIAVQLKLTPESPVIKGEFKNAIPRNLIDIPAGHGAINGHE